MARYGYGKSSSYYSYNYGRKGCVKSYNNAAYRTCAQCHFPTKKSSGTWYDANGKKIENVEAYFDAMIPMVGIGNLAKSNLIHTVR